MIALGESVVAVGIGASGLRRRAGELLAVATLGLTLSTELWWVYFVRRRRARPRGALRAMVPDQRQFLRDERRLLLGPPPDARSGSSAIAAGLERAIGHRLRRAQLRPGTGARRRDGPLPGRTCPLPVRCSGCRSSPGARSPWCWRSRRSRSGPSYLRASSARGAGRRRSAACNAADGRRVRETTTGAAIADTVASRRTWLRRGPRRPPRTPCA